MDRSKLAVVDRFASQVEADLAKCALESAGIDATIQADRAGGMRDHLAWSGFGFKVLVREEDAPTAHDVLSPSRRSELVLIQAFPTQAEADTAQGALLSAGIAATVEDDSATGWRPNALWGGTSLRVLVPKEHADKARYVLKHLREAPAQGNA